jgi:hypothetical protein
MKIWDDNIGWMDAAFNTNRWHNTIVGQSITTFECFAIGFLIGSGLFNPQAFTNDSWKSRLRSGAGLGAFLAVFGWLANDGYFIGIDPWAL